jgi:hypothetical protein
MKRGVAFDCGHGVDERGTPLNNCPACHTKIKNAIADWETNKKVSDKIKKGDCPF